MLLAAAAAEGTSAEGAVLSLDFLGTGSELEFSRAAPEMTADDDDAALSVSNREECRSVIMMPRCRCLLFDSPANVPST